MIVHSGTLQFSDSIPYDEYQVLEKYVQHGIIVVMPAFRVNLFGFIDLGEDVEDAPYNVGLYGKVVCEGDLKKFIERVLK